MHFLQWWAAWRIKKFGKKIVLWLVQRWAVWIYWLKGAGNWSHDFLSKDPRADEVWCLWGFERSGLLDVSLMDSVTLSVRDGFLSHWHWLDSLCFEERWPGIYLAFSASMVLSLNSLATPPFYFIMTGNRSWCKNHTEFALPPLPRPHEQSCENQPLLAYFPNP